MPEEPSSLHAAIEGPLDLPGGEALLAAAHHIHDLQPDVHRGVTGLEDGPDSHGELLPAGIAFPQAGAAAPALQATGAVDHAAMWADWTVWPKLRFDVSKGGGFALELGAGKGGLHG